MASTGRSLRDLAAAVGGRVIGDGERSLDGVATLEGAGERQVAAFHDGRYREAFVATRAGAIVVGADAVAGPVPAGALLVCENPYLAFAKLSAAFQPPARPVPGRHPSAVIEASAEIDPSCEIGAHVYIGAGVRIASGTIVRPGCVIEAGSRIGRDCLIHANVSIRERCVLGDRVLLQQGSVIGSDGFGFAFDSSTREHLKVPQTGIARLEDDVEIGAGSCVDRGSLGETVIGHGTKIDNLVQVAHNVTIGPLSLICAQVGIAGSTEVGAGVVFGGQAGLVGHIKIGDGVKLGAKTGAVGDIPPGETWVGFPARPHQAWLRASALFMRLPDIVKELKALKTAVAKLTAAKR